MWHELKSLHSKKSVQRRQSWTWVVHCVLRPEADQSPAYPFSVALQARLAPAPVQSLFEVASLHFDFSHLTSNTNEEDPSSNTWSLSKAVSWLVSLDSLLVRWRAPDSWSKGCESESRQERRENFLLQSQLCVLTLIRCPLHPPCYRSGT